MKGIKKTWRRFGLLGIVVLAIVSLSVASFAGAVYADQNVQTSAVVEGTSIAPEIECKWELPDMDSYTSGMQYEDEGGNHDDDPMMPTPMYPCDLDEGGYPAMDQGAHNMVQVLANAEDDPTTKTIELWAAVDHEFGLEAISDVYWKIFHPDGEPKIQVHGTKVDCEAYGDSVTDGTMFNAAHETGQISAEAIDNDDSGLISLCVQGDKAFYRSSFELSKHQPCGEYIVELHAVSSGVESVLVNYLDVICFYHMEIDFETSINWGAIQPGVKDVIPGNLTFNPSESPSAPTVKNTGNSGMQVGIHFDEMVQQGTTLPKIIDTFDACFGDEPTTAGLQCVDPIMASEQVWFGNGEDPDATPHQVLCSNETGKLDLSIHPPTTLPSGQYIGSMDVYARSAEAPLTCPTDQGHITH